MVCPRCFTKISAKETRYVCTNVGCPESGKRPMDRTKLEGSTNFLGAAHPPKCAECKREAADRICPSCGMLLPFGIDGNGVREVAISVIGAKAAGKSNYIAVLIKMIREQMVLSFNMNTRACNDSTMKRYNTDFYNPVFRQHVCVKATDASVQEIDPLMYHLTITDGSAKARVLHALTLTFFDTAGENLDSEDIMSVVNKYIYHSQGIILLLDPLQMPTVRNALEGKGIHLPLEYTDPLDLLTRTINLIRKGLRKPAGQIDIPIALAFTKIDATRCLLDPSLSLHNPSTHLARGAFDELDFNTVNMDMQALIEQWYSSELASMLQANFRTYAFFGLSALGSDPDRSGAIPQLRPFRVEDPFLWLLWKNRVLKP